MQDRTCSRSYAKAVAGLALLLPACLLALPSFASAGQRHLILKYEIYVGGMRTFDIAYDAQLAPSAYDMKMSLKGRGILDWWFSWQLKAFSEGRVADGAVVPVRAGVESTWSGRRRHTWITYMPGGLPRVEVDPAPRHDNGRKPVPPDLRKGARDPAGAVFALLSRVADRGRCDVREPVFDGRRRYDLVMTEVGHDSLAPNQYSPYGGPALECRLTLDRIAGYKRDGSPSRWGMDQSATVWLGKPFSAAPPLPVRLSLDTPLGALKAYLADATIRSDGAEHSLAALP